MKEFVLGPELRIDLMALVDTRLLVQANSGGGKSMLLRRLLEQTHHAIQHLVIDPEGEFSSLREKFDYVLAGKGGDTPTDPRSAKLLAERLLAGERKMLDYLIEQYPAGVSRHDLGEAAGYTAAGGTFRNYLGTLRRNGLIDVQGETISASSTLFQENLG